MRQPGDKTAGPLTHLLRQRLEKAGGWLSFEAFMQAALYEPQRGYYECREVFGEQGDFVTAVDLGPWLALALTDLAAWAWRQMGSPSEWRLLEQGGGSGRLLVAVCRRLANLNVTPPALIQSVEAAAAMRAQQQKTYAAAGLEVQQLQDLHAAKADLPTLFFCNELVDAMPVRCFRWHQGQFIERGVSWGEGRFVWADADAPLVDPPAVDDDIRQAWPDAYCSEWRPLAGSWQRQLAAVLGQGYAITVDYGFSQREYYRPQRIQGTLLAHAGHQAFADVLAEPGRRDITAHVDFTALCRAGLDAGLTPICFTSQGAWLAQSPGVQGEIQQLARKPEVHAPLLAHAKRLMLPFGMGELFKLCLQSLRAPTQRPDYLQQFDHLDRLGL